MRRAERDIFDAALLILELVDCFQPRFGDRQIGSDAAQNLPAQDVLPLLGDEPLLGIAHIAQDQFEFGSVKLAVGVLQLWIRGNAPRDIGVGQTKTHLMHALIESGLRNHLAEHLPVEPESAGAVGRQRPSKFAADLLQAILVILLEAIDRYFSIADLGEAGAAKATKNIVDAPDGEAASQQRHHRGHEAAAKPIFGGFANTSEHAANVEMRRPVPRGGAL